jgi:hypothetical protein
MVIVGAVLGQQTVSPITAALAEAETLARAVPNVLHFSEAIPAGMVVGHITTAWNSSTEVATAGALKVYGWAGEQFQLKLETVAHLPSHIAHGVAIGTLELDGPGVTESTPIEAMGSLSGPSDSWRLER